MAALPGACLVIVWDGAEVEALKQRKVACCLWVLLKSLRTGLPHLMCL